MHLKARFPLVLLAMIYLGASQAPAMDILFFVRMALDDQSDYVTALVIGSAKMLRQTGHPDEARKAIDLFKDPSKNGGLNQLAMNIKALQEKNTVSQSATNGRTTHYDVEAAMQQTLRQNGIDVPLKYLETINRTFAPQLPLRAHAIGGA